MAFIDPWDRRMPISPNIADILIPGAPVGSPSGVTPNMYPTTPNVLDGMDLISGGYTPTPSDPIDDQHAHIAHTARTETTDDETVVTTEEETTTSDPDSLIRDWFNQIYTDTRNYQSADYDADTQLARLRALYGSDAYRDSIYFIQAIFGRPRSDGEIATLAANTLKAWTKSLDPEMPWRIRTSAAGNADVWSTVIHSYGVLSTDEVPTTDGIPDDPWVHGPNWPGEFPEIAAPAINPNQLGLDAILQDPRYFQTLWQQSQGIPETGRTAYEEWLADQWRIPAINYALMQDPMVSPGASLEGDDLSFTQTVPYWDYLQSLEDRPKGWGKFDIEPGLVEAYSELDREEQLSTLGRLSSVPGLANLEQILYESSLSGQGIPSWLSSNLASQRFKGRHRYDLGPEGLDPAAPSFFNTLVGMDPLAFGRGGVSYNSPFSSPINVFQPEPTTGYGGSIFDPMPTTGLGSSIGSMAHYGAPSDEFVSPFAPYLV
jgi:hypothetical protein